MGHYRVVATGSHSPEPTETVVETASAALARVAAYRRLCGRSGTVEVFGRNDRRVGEDTLVNAAAKEAAGGGPRKPIDQRTEAAPPS